jgi:crotonobetainyl-CoA:carnitine CoA-transferase CaiB-like acyl-CoA transferase
MIKPRTADPMTPPPLHGVRVLDLSRLLPGPYCTWTLAALGAEVIRIEPPTGGDYTRELPPVIDGHGVFFAAINRGKRSVTLDLRRAEGREVFGALLKTADVLVEGFKPGVMAEIGLDPIQLGEAFPRLITCSITGYGQTGPLALEPGHDLNYQGLAGIIAAAGGEGTPWPVQVADLAGGAQSAALAIVAALFGRLSHGRGTSLDCSMTEGSMALLAPHLATALAESRDLNPGGELLTGGYSAYRSYACADGRWLTVAPLEPKFMARFVGVLSGFAEVGTEVDTSEEGLRARFLTRPRDEWVSLLQGCCVGPALTAQELPSHPQHVARGAFEPVLGLPMVRAPFPWAQSAEVPRLGEGNVEILGALGLAPSLIHAATGGL